MSEEKDLNYFKNLSYNSILKKIGGIYYLYIPELSIIAKGETPGEAYEMLEKEKESYFKNAIDLGIQDTLKEPNAITMRNKLYTDTAVFFIKMAIVTVILASTIICSRSFIEIAVSRAVNKFPDKAFVFVSELSDKIDNKLDSMSAEDKEKVRLKIRKAVGDIKPFIDEVKALSKE